MMPLCAAWVKGRLPALCRVPSGPTKHLKTCTWLVNERGDIVPERDLPDIIRAYNLSVGGVRDDMQGYHETLTHLNICGVRLFFAAREAEALHRRVIPVLLAAMARRDWPLRFYTRERLFAVVVRRELLAPDFGAISLCFESVARNSR